VLVLCLSSAWSDLRADPVLSRELDKSPPLAPAHLSGFSSIDYRQIFRQLPNKNVVPSQKFQGGVCKNFSEVGHQRIFAKAKLSFSAAIIVEIAKLFWMRFKKKKREPEVSSRQREFPSTQVFFQVANYCKQNLTLGSNRQF